MLRARQTLRRAVCSSELSGYSSRQYARAVGGILNQPPPPAPTPQPEYKTIQVSDKSPSWQSLIARGKFRGPSNKLTGQAPEFHLDISKPPQDMQQTEFRTVLEPPRLTPTYELHQHLIDSIQKASNLQHSPSLRQLMADLDGKVNAEIPHILSNGNAGSPSFSLNEIADSVVTIAHVLPPKQGQRDGEVILCSGFAILDGAHIATCTHPFHQINAHCRGSDGEMDVEKLSRARTIVITKNGELLPLLSLESHLVMSDVVVLRISEAASLVPLKVSPYPCPAGNPIQVYNLHETLLNTDSKPVPKWSWKDSEITLYQDRAGREAATGTYDELNTLLFDSVPLPGSSGGPIIDRETKAVVGVVRGSEISYAVRKERGFGTPAETLFNVFKLEM